MIQGAQAQRDQRPDQVGADIKWIEGTPVGEQGLDDLRSKTESEGHGEEGEIERPATSSVQDPIEGNLKLDIC